MGAAEQLWVYPFPEDQVYGVIDYETFSEADLKKVGAFEYSVHQSTDVLCLAWRVGTRATLLDAPTKAWAPDLGGDDLEDFIRILSDRSIILVAHNALFEQLITENVFKRRYARGLQTIPIERWLCTASLAAAVSLPRQLAMVGTVLGLKIQKDIEGHKLMLKHCKPRKPTKKNPATRHTDLTERLRIREYCRTDVDTEVRVFLKCPPLSEFERRVWLLDQRINHNGFLVDRDLISKTLSMIAVETARLNTLTEAETFGYIQSANQHAAVRAWLASEGVELPNMQKKTIEDALKSGNVTGTAKALLEFRQAVSKTSTAKYVAFERRSRHDGRLRDILMYHGAGTGRWTGVGVQPQNFPKGTLENPILAAEIMTAGDLELVRMLYGEPMEVFSSALRCMIVAPKDKVLDVADYSAIEARVLAWMAGDAKALERFKSNHDAYKELATKIFGVALEAVTPEQRDVGKSAELGCGYQMGAARFVSSCDEKGQTVSEELAILAVRTYRAEHPAVVEAWEALNSAAMAAVENPGKTYGACRTKWFVRARFLWCILPSGRRLAYPFPSVEFATRWFVEVDGKQVWAKSRDELKEIYPDLNPKAVSRKTLFYWGISSYTRQWAKEATYGGKITENVVQATARDLMAAAMLRIEATGIWQIVLSVHDELLGERYAFEGSKDEFERLMTELPPWAEGCPVKVKGWSGTRYRK